MLFLVLYFFLIYQYKFLKVKHDSNSFRASQTGLQRHLVNAVLIFTFAVQYCATNAYNVWMQIFSYPATWMNELPWRDNVSYCKL